MTRRIMWAINLFVLPMVVVSFMFILLINNQRRVPGELVFESNLIEFGSVPEWKGPVTKPIKVWNKGKEKIVIERVEANCGYVKIENPEEIKPGKNATFSIVLDPKLARSNESSGVVIFTNSPKTPRLYLTVAFTIERFAELSAEICDFGEIAPNSDYEKKFLLRVNIPMDMDGIKLAASNSPVLKWRMEEGASSERHINVKLGPIKSRGIFSSMLTLIFPNGRTLTLPVVARVVGPVKAHPESIFYGTVAQGEEPSAELALESETDFRVLKIHAPKDLVIEDSQEKGSQTSFTMKVRWHPSYIRRILREEIRVMTNVDPEPIRIPVYGIVQEKE